MSSARPEYGKYVLDRPLARGGMGTVWVAVDPQLGRQVALKTIAIEVNPRTSTQFQREASTLARLQHSNIVQIYDYGTANERPYIVMELLKGEDLAARQRRVGHFTLMGFAPIFDQICKGLTAAHRAGIVHRDLKPGNVFLCQSERDESVKLVDFGLASFAAGAVEEDTSKLVVGTPHYMSPEQARRRTTDHRSDLWSLGVVAYQALTGRLPFTAQAASEIILALCADPVVPPSTLVAELDEEVDAFFERALAREVDRRFRSAEEMAGAYASLCRAREARASKILVVDDEPDLESLIRQRFRRAIKAGTYEFVFAGDGLAGLEQFRLHPDIDIVLSDIRMPGMDGLTMLARVKELAPYTEVVMVSAFGDMQNIREAMNRGAFDFLPKPYELDDLQATVDKTAARVREARRGRRSTQENEVLRMFANHHLMNMLADSRNGVNVRGGDTCEATIWVLGLMTEGIDGVQLLDATNLVMDAVLPEILKRDGAAVRFTENSMVALFTGDNHAARAAATAAAAHEAVEVGLAVQLRHDPPRNFALAGIRSTLCSGKIGWGPVGARALRRMEHVVFGEPMRAALTLLDTAKAGDILAEPSVVDAAHGLGVFDPTSIVTVSSRDGHVLNLVRRASTTDPATTEVTEILADSSTVLRRSQRGSTGS